MCSILYFNFHLPFFTYLLHVCDFFFIDCWCSVVVSSYKQLQMSVLFRGEARHGGDSIQ